MNTEMDYLKIIVTIALSVVGWLVANYLSKKRDVAQKSRDIVTERLIESYSVLAKEILHREHSSERTRKIQDTIADIQLFGTPNQVHLVKVLADKISNNEVHELNPLINSLRDDLREQLDLPKIEGDVKWLRSNEEIHRIE